MTPHSAYVWHPLHCRWHRIHFITPNHCIYDVTSTSGMTPHPLYETLHPLHLCHHNLHWYHTHFCMTSHPASVWHHMHYIELYIQSLCHHSTLLMTSQPLYMKPHPEYRATYTLYMRHHSHHLCPHPQSIDNITPTLCMTSHSPYVWHRLPYTRHYILTLWPQTTVFMYHTHYIWHRVHSVWMCHHIHCIADFTRTVFLRSFPL